MEAARHSQHLQQFLQMYPAKLHHTRIQTHPHPAHLILLLRENLNHMIHQHGIFVFITPQTEVILKEISWTCTNY